MVLITGGSGMVGSKLARLLKENGYQVRILAREESAKKLKLKGIDAYSWNLESRTIQSGAFEGVKQVIHLAGENIGDKRWSVARKQAILDSRVHAAETLANGMKAANANVESLICASAIGYYGNVESSKECVETSHSGSGFQADVTVAWEKAMQVLLPYAKNHYFTRIGIVLSNAGGAFPKLIMPAKMALSGLGSGKQMMSWIHEDDISSAFLHLLKNTPASGIYNFVADNPVSNGDFMVALTHSFGYKPIFPAVPAFMLKLILGEMATLVLGGAKVSNDKLKKTGFACKYPLVQLAVDDLVKHR